MSGHLTKFIKQNSNDSSEIIYTIGLYLFQMGYGYKSNHNIVIQGIVILHVLQVWAIVYHHRS